MMQQMHNPGYIPNVHGQITEMKHSNSNNCIAVTQPMYNILQTDSSHQNISTNNFMEQQMHNPTYIPNVHGQITEMKHSDSNNCIAVTRPMNNILQTDSSHQNISTNNFMEQQIQNPAYIPNVHGQITEMKIVIVITILLLLGQ